MPCLLCLLLCRAERSGAVFRVTLVRAAWSGFSYSADPRDRVYDEKVVAADMLDFLLAFYDKFPEYEGRELYITGEVCC